MISAEKLADVFVEMADTLVDDFDLVDFLHNLAERAVTICGALAAGILLADQHNDLQYLAASSADARLVELFQIQRSGGPCFDCFHTGQPVINSDLAAAEGRWPEFVRRALEAGFDSVHAIPLRLRNTTIGTLNIFGGATGRFDQTDVKIVQSLADVATIAILQERSVQRAETLTEQLHGALSSRVAVEQAKGALSAMRNISAEQAFEAMRAHARQNRRRLGDVAHAVLADPRSVPELTTPSQP